jgi:23S rRNA (pseudouridine1915-N3)-methyltransferase
MAQQRLETNLRVSLVAVGTKMPNWVQSGCNDYSKRLPPEFKIKTIEIPLGMRSKNQSSKKAIDQECASIIKVLEEKDFLIALDVNGKSMSTAKLASEITNWQMQGLNICFLIGGPDGLSLECLNRADLVWSLSDLTLPHPLVRILLLEQIYRAWTITINHPYHRQ